VRNDFVFHYSPTDLDAEFDKAPADELDLYIEPDTHANTLYYFAEALANRAALRRTQMDVGPDSFGQFHNEILRVARLFSCFIMAFLHGVLVEHK
jgi:hypothetical protein